MTTPGGGGDPDISLVATALADRSRAAMVMALLDGRALPASVLAAEAGVAPSTASGHLTRLVDAGLLAVRAQGRHRYYALAGPDIAALVELLARLAPTRPVRSLRQGTKAAALRRARTCYDHLAGALGVAVFGHLVATGCLVGGDGLHHPETATQDRLSARGRDHAYRLTPGGRVRLSTLVTVPDPDPDDTVPVAYCVDWTEQRHHLSGAVGRALTSALFERGWLARRDGGRAVLLSDEGADALVGTGLLPARAG